MTASTRSQGTGETEQRHRNTETGPGVGYVARFVSKYSWNVDKNPSLGAAANVS